MRMSLQIKDIWRARAKLIQNICSSKLRITFNHKHLKAPNQYFGMFLLRIEAIFGNVLYEARRNR